MIHVNFFYSHLTTITCAFEFTATTIPCEARRWRNANSWLQDLHMLLDATRRWRGWKVRKRELVVASTRHHRARLLKYYPRPSCAPSFVKSRMLRPLQTHFSLSQQIFVVLACIHPGNARVPPRVLASVLKPCGGNKTFCLESCLRSFASGSLTAAAIMR